jgi:ankyrin repeat protein
LQQGADYSLANHSGDTALSLAKKNGHHDIVRLLQNNGAKK